MKTRMNRYCPKYLKIVTLKEESSLMMQ